MAQLSASIEVLEAVGKWMDTNGKTIYGSSGNAERRRELQLLAQGQHALCARVQLARTHARSGVARLLQTRGGGGDWRPQTQGEVARVLKTGKKVDFTQDEFSFRLTGLPLVAPDQPASVIEVECDGEPMVDHAAMRPLY